MKVSGINYPAKRNYSANNSSKNNHQKSSSLNFRGDEATKVGATVLIAAALIGFFTYLGLAPQEKHFTKPSKDNSPKKSAKTSFSKKNVTVNRPPNKHRQTNLQKT